MLSRLLLWAGLSLTIGPADVCADQGPRLNHQPSDSPLALPSPEGGQAQLPAALLSPQSRPAASEVLLKGMIRPLSRPKTDGILVAQMSHRGPLGPVGISNRRSSLDPEFETLTHARTTTPSRASSTGTLFAQAIPKEAEAQYKKATELLKKEKNVEAIQVLHQALDLYPDYFLALQALGVVYVREGQFEAALKTLSHAIQVNPKSDVSFLSIGIAQLNLNRMEESIQSLRQSTALNPHLPTATSFSVMPSSRAVMPMRRRIPSNLHFVSEGAG